MPITEIEFANGRRIPVKCAMSLGKSFIGEGLEHLPYSTEPFAGVRCLGKDGQPVALKKIHFSHERIGQAHDTLSFKFQGELM